MENTEQPKYRPIWIPCASHQLSSVIQIHYTQISCFARCSQKTGTLAIMIFLSISWVSPEFPHLSASGNGDETECFRYQVFWCFWFSWNDGKPPVEVQRSFESENTQVLTVRTQNKVKKNNFAQWRWKERGFDWICSNDRVTINFPSPLWLVIHWSLQSSPRRRTIQRIQRSPRMAAGYPLDSKSREGCNAVTVSTAWPETWSGIYWTISTVAWTCWEDFQGLHGSNWWLDVSVSKNFDGGFKQLYRVHESKDLILLVRTCCTRLTGANETSFGVDVTVYVGRKQSSQIWLAGIWYTTDLLKIFQTS